MTCAYWSEAEGTCELPRRCPVHRPRKMDEHYAIGPDDDPRGIVAGLVLLIACWTMLAACGAAIWWAAT